MHRQELTGNYPVFTVITVIYHYVERIGEYSLPLIFCITYAIIKKYHPGKLVNIHILSLINIIQENNWEITTKKGKGKLSLFFGNGERAIHLYGGTRCLTL